MMPQTHMNIALSSDVKFSRPLATTISSILSNAGKFDYFNFYILDGGLLEIDKDKLKKLKKIKDFNIEFINIKNGEFENCPTCQYWFSNAVYYRFKLPSLFKNFDKLLYIDCDLIVRKSLKSLYETPLDNSYAVVVEDINFKLNTLKDPNLAQLMKERLEVSKYFNSGVMLLNLKKMRDDNIEVKCFDFLNKYPEKILYADQCVLNAVFKNNVKFLDEKFNFQFQDERQKNYKEHRQLYEKLKSDVIILHYTGPKKPWKDFFNKEINSEYHSYFKKTPYFSRFDDCPRQKHVIFNLFHKLKQTFWFFLSYLPAKIAVIFGKKLEESMSDNASSDDSNGIIKANYRNVIDNIKLKIKNKQKIKVGFWVLTNSTWAYQSLYDEMLQSDIFEPIIFLPKIVPSQKINSFETDKILSDNIEFFKSKNIDYEVVYDYEYDKYLDLKDFGVDIVFYQQPFGIHKAQGIPYVSTFALCCCVSYCFYVLDYHFSYLDNFHKLLWKNFVECDEYKEKYKKRNGAKNCVSTGYLRLDDFRKFDNFKKDPQKLVIYAPHHSVNSTHLCGTFAENAYFILDLIKKHKDIQWVFKPHPMLYYTAIQNGVMTKEEIDNYFKQWEELENASVYTKGDYYELFMQSDLMITDSLTFLVEYLVTQKPLIRPISKCEFIPFTNLAKKLVRNYYNTHSNEELLETFSRVLLNKDDYLAPKRLKSLKYLELDKNKTIASKIMNYLKKELKIL